MRQLQHLMINLVFTALVPAATVAAEISYSGSEACQTCHEKAYTSWKSSHHYQAMLPATEETVLGDFSGQTFKYANISSRFYRKDGKYYVQTDNENGELQEYQIEFTFGFHPLQQYLVPFPNGRYQALNIVWDSRRKEEGGQRWIHLYPDDPVTHQDIVHWTGSFQNWNARCAVCHSTGLEKNYSSVSDSYRTTWKEINVACEACHGPASRHLEWARGDQLAENRGFDFTLNDRGAFGPVSGGSEKVFSRLDGRRPMTQLDTCGACHARRSELAEYHAGETFNDQYRLALIEQGLYFPDGQIREEVYVYGSFLQSKMHEAGVVCSNCHDAHSNALLFEGNRLCTQCHVSTVYDQAKHHRHEENSEGAACINCHMPARTYMVVDDRRDHSFRVPQPRLTIELGVPNSCNQCHQDKEAQWAMAALDSWGVSGEDRTTQATSLAAAWDGQPSALPGLLELASRESNPAIVRASAALATMNYPSQETLFTVQQLLSSDDSLLRASAVRSMDWLPEAQRYALLRDLITDGSKSVRMAVARQLLGFPADQLPAESARELNSLWREYLEAMQLNADMPEEQLNLGMFHLAAGDPIAAEKAYRTALKLSPFFIPAMLNLADLYRANGMDAQAEPLLQKAISLAPAAAPPHHAMGLLRVRQGRLEEAVPSLRTAALAEPQDYRYSYVYAVALWETGRKEEAVAELEAALERLPGNREIVSALGSYYQQLGDQEKLRVLMEKYSP